MTITNYSCEGTLDLQFNPAVDLKTQDITVGLSTLETLRPTSTAVDMPHYWIGFECNLNLNIKKQHSNADTQDDAYKYEILPGASTGAPISYAKARNKLKTGNNIYTVKRWNYINNTPIGATWQNDLPINAGGVAYSNVKISVDQHGGYTCVLQTNNPGGTPTSNEATMAEKDGYAQEIVITGEGAVTPLAPSETDADKLSATYTPTPHVGIAAGDIVDGANTKVTGLFTGAAATSTTDIVPASNTWDVKNTLSKIVTEKAHKSGVGGHFNSEVVFEVGDSLTLLYAPGGGASAATTMKYAVQDTGTSLFGTADVVASYHVRAVVFHKP